MSWWRQMLTSLRIGVLLQFEALARNGHTPTALRLATKTSYPSYGYMFCNEHEPSTSLWELWDSDRGSATMDSRNHIYSASISTFFFKHLAGIEAASPGYSRATIAPFVSASREDMRGLHTLQARPAQLGSWDTFQGPSQTRMRYAAC